MILDVFAPTDGANLPVYVFIQGGGFIYNSNSNYNGSDLVAASGNNIVVITINYRVGPFGFLAAPGIDQLGASFNNGLKDMIGALSWVNQYISIVCVTLLRCTMSGGLTIQCHSSGVTLVT